MKMSRCDRCMQENLVWVQSKKGNWYLADPKTITTNTYGKNITIPFAHRCKEEVSYERNESFLFDLCSRSGA
jgi:hypothetical protein